MSYRFLKNWETFKSSWMAVWTKALIGALRLISLSVILSIRLCVHVCCTQRCSYMCMFNIIISILFALQVQTEAKTVGVLKHFLDKARQIIKFRTVIFIVKMALQRSFFASLEGPLGVNVASFRTEMPPSGKSYILYILLVKWSETKSWTVGFFTFPIFPIIYPML